MICIYIYIEYVSLVYVMKGQYVYVCICMYKYMYHYPVQYIVLTYFNCMVQIGATNTICIHHITTGNKQYIVTIRNVHVTYTELKTKHFIGKYSCNNDPSWSLITTWVVQTPASRQFLDTKDVGNSAIRVPNYFIVKWQWFIIRYHSSKDLWNPI
jgi:hypothetical protein